MNEVFLSETINAPVEKVWRALTDVDQMRQWYFPMLETFKPVKDFETSFNVHHNDKDFPHVWKVTDAIENKLIAYDWRFDGFPGNSHLTFELTDQGASTILNIKHSGLDSFRPDLHPDLSAENFKEGWQQLVQALKNFAEK